MEQQEFKQRPGLEHDQEIHRNITNRFRSFFSSQRAFVIQEEGSEIDLGGQQTYWFPYSGIEWNSLIILGHTGDFSRNLFPNGGWQPCLEFHDPQTQRITLKPYRRLTSLFLSDPQDFPGDFNRCFQIGEGSDFFPAPVVIPFFDFSRGVLDWVEDSKLFTLPGTLAIYAPPTPRGMELLQQEFLTITQVLKGSTNDLEFCGIREYVELDQTINSFPGFHEGSISFKTKVLVDLQEDQYWAMPY